MDEGAAERKKKWEREEARQTVLTSWSQSLWVGGVQGSPRGALAAGLQAAPVGPGALSRVLTRPAARGSSEG